MTHQATDADDTTREFEIDSTKAQVFSEQIEPLPIGQSVEKQPREGHCVDHGSSSFLFSAESVIGGKSVEPDGTLIFCPACFFEELPQTISAGFTPEEAFFYSIYELASRGKDGQLAPFQPPGHGAFATMEWSIEESNEDADSVTVSSGQMLEMLDRTLEKVEDLSSEGGGPQ